MATKNNYLICDYSDPSQDISPSCLQSAALYISQLRMEIGLEPIDSAMDEQPHSYDGFLWYLPHPNDSSEEIKANKKVHLFAHNTGLKLKFVPHPNKKYS